MWGIEPFGRFARLTLQEAISGAGYDGGPRGSWDSWIDLWRRHCGRHAGGLHGRAGASRWPFADRESDRGGQLVGPPVALKSTPTTMAPIGAIVITLSDCRGDVRTAVDFPRPADSAISTW